MRFGRILLTLACCGLAFSAAAQTYPMGLNPLSLRWQQIDTDKVQVIFPSGSERQAQRVANLVHYLQDNHSESIGHRKEKVSIILQNQTTVPNGFVALSPFRSELYLTPPQKNFLGTGDWIDLLTIHEYRHVKQITNARQGVTKIVSTIFGQNGLAFMRRMALPRWWTEGDAVVQETALTRSGRGRLPEFVMEYKSLLLGMRDYNYEKASAGSLKDFVPDHYTLGYYMVGEARRRFGEEIWQGIFHNAVDYDGIFYPLSRGLKKQTGLNTPKLYRATMQTLDSMWQSQMNQMSFTPVQPVNTESIKTFTEYHFPRFTADGELIAQKSSFRDIRKFVKIDKSGREKTLTRPGLNFSHNTSLSVSGNLLAWADLTYDVRWGNKDFSVVKIYNMATNKTLKLTSESKFFSPVLSPDQERIAVAETTPAQTYSLTLLNARTGNVVKRLPNPENYFLAQPTWTEDGRQLVVVSQYEGEQALLQYDVESGEGQFLTPFTVNQISYPFVQGDFVYFSGTYTGINNIYAVRLSTGDMYQITSVPLGAFEPSVSPDGNTLVYTEFSADGYLLRQTPIDRARWIVTDTGVENQIGFYQPLEEQEEGEIFGKVGDETFPIKKYNRLSGLIYPHSIQPYPVHPNYGLEIQSDNKFSTMSVSAGYSYNVNENQGNFYANLTYAELFPVIEAGVVAANNRNRTNPFLDARITQADTSFSLGLYSREWNETDIHAGFTLPFNISHGNYFSNIRLSGKFHALDVDYQETGLRFDQQLTASSSDFYGLDGRFRFSRQQTTARQNINPRFAQFLDVQYKSTIGTLLNEGDVFRAEGSLYFPGLFPNHSFYGEAEWQQEGFTESYKFQNNFTYARGYNAMLHDRIGRFSVNYTLPLLYPDLALGPFAFIKRIKANFFYDQNDLVVDDIDASTLPNNTPFPGITGNFNGFSESYRSTGVELSFDFRAFRLIELDLGVRYSYLFDTGQISSANTNEHQFDFIILGIGGI